MAAFKDEWPDAETVNLLDDALGKDLNSGTFGHDLIEQRIEALGNYGERMGADGILYSCSAFGKEIDAVKGQLEIPVLKPNEAMFEEALMIGGKIGMIATYRPSIPSMEKEFYALADELGKGAQLDSIFVDDAMAALSHNDLQTHNNLIREASSVFTDYQVVMLAQFSASQAMAGVEERLGCTVLTSPLSAVRKMKNTPMSN
ncbi:MAG: aspartate/glutamate racemase family protein [Deltaproteobacteria bacterium]|nr:aspartate/glutamate racemase family protein [Deltaproteobacteria bacterium]